MKEDVAEIKSSHGIGCVPRHNGTGTTLFDFERV